MLNEQQDPEVTHAARATYSIEEGRAILGVGRNLAYEMAHTGVIPTIRLGRRMLIPRAALEALLRAPGALGSSPADDDGQGERRDDR